MEIKPIKRAVVPKFFAIAAALTAAGTLTACRTAGEVAQPTGLVPVECDTTEEFALAGDVAVENDTDYTAETETEAITTQPDESDPMPETETFMLAGNLDVEYCTDDCEECTPAAEPGQEALDALKSAFAARNITLQEDGSYYYAMLNSTLASTENPAKAIVYFYDGNAVMDDIKIQDYFEMQRGEIHGYRLTEWGAAYTDGMTYTALINVSSGWEMTDENAEKIVQELFQS